MPHKKPLLKCLNADCKLTFSTTSVLYVPNMLIIKKIVNTPSLTLHKYLLNDNFNSCLTMIKMHFNALAKKVANFIHVFSSALTVCQLCPDFK